MEEPQSTEAPSPVVRKENAWLDLLRFAVLTAIIVLPIRIFIVQPFLVSGQSMDPTFHNNEYLIVDRVSYRFNTPERGDVVIFRFPFSQKKFLIKRVIGLPGETVSIKEQRVTITNAANPEGIRLEEPYVIFAAELSPPTELTLGSEEYFVMGDNRKASVDSRIWGPLHVDYIIGKPLLRLFPWSKLDAFPGKN